MSAEAEQQIQRALGEEYVPWSRIEKVIGWLNEKTGRRCISCDHMLHNELAYCQTASCSCAIGTEVGSNLRMLKRHAVTAEALAAQVPEGDEDPPASPIRWACDRCGRGDNEHQQGRKSAGCIYTISTRSTWLPVTPVEQAHATPAQVPDISARVREVCDQVEANPTGWGGAPAVSLARTVRNLLADPERDPWLSGMSSSTGAWSAAPPGAATEGLAERVRSWLPSHEASVAVTDALTARGIFMLRPKVREVLREASRALLDRPNGSE